MPDVKRQPSRHYLADFFCERTRGSSNRLRTADCELRTATPPSMNNERTTTYGSFRPTALPSHIQIRTSHGGDGQFGVEALDRGFRFELGQFPVLFPFGKDGVISSGVLASPLTQRCSGGGWNIDFDEIVVSMRAIGPPSTASGEICPMHGPELAPEKRPSVMRRPSDSASGRRRWHRSSCAFPACP